MLNQFKAAVEFSPQGESVGNLTIGRGVVDGKPAYVAVIENKIASGAIGVGECDKLASLFKVIETTRAPLVFYIDSAGARVSEGLPALGAFRRMFAAALKVSVSGAPMACVLGTHCFGGASMLASLCGVRYFNQHTRLAMSGPSILAAAAGASAIDDTFRAVAEVSIGTGGRIKIDNTNREFAGSVSFLAAQTTEARHQQLAERLAAAKLYKKGQSGKVERKDFTALYPGGYDLKEVDGILQGSAGDIAIIGSIDRQPMSAARAHGMSALVWQMLAGGAAVPVQLHVLVDCEAHSASLDDEKVMLSVYLVDLAHALLAMARRGTKIETIVLGKLGGGSYVALAAPSSEVNLIYGMEIQLLPGKAIAAILGDASGTAPEFADYLKAGVAEHELKIGVI